MDNTGSNVVMIVLIIALVVGASAGFYFWETYLFAHYLGGYDEYGLPVQQSYPGFYFFIRVWPLWLFPLAIGAVVIALIYTYHINKARRLEQKLAQVLREKEQSFDLLEKELHALKHKLDKIKRYAHLQEKHRQLEQAHLRLKQDYERSLEFIKKLLESPPGTN